MAGKVDTYGINSAIFFANAVEVSKRLDPPAIGIKDPNTGDEWHDILYVKFFVTNIVENIDGDNFSGEYSIQISIDGGVTYSNLETNYSVLVDGLYTVGPYITNSFVPIVNNNIRIRVKSQQYERFYTESGIFTIDNR